MAVHEHLARFLEAVRGDARKAFMPKRPQADALYHFHLGTTAEVIAFLDQEAERCTFINERPLENSDHHCVVYAYEFPAGTQNGYLAFYLAPRTGKWIIKSFKPSDRPKPVVLGHRIQIPEALMALLLEQPDKDKK